MVVVQMIKATACLSRRVSTCSKLWGPCPCGHDPRPCTCVQGPKKSPIIPTPPRRAARTTRSQRFLNSSSCEISAVSLTTAPGNQVDLHNRDIDRPARTATAKDIEAEVHVLLVSLFLLLFLPLPPRRGRRKRREARPTTPSRLLGRAEWDVVPNTPIQDLHAPLVLRLLLLLLLLLLMEPPGLHISRRGP